MAHEHDIDGQYLAPSDGAILDVYGAGEDLTIEVVLPCPECDQALEVTFGSPTAVEESDIDFSLDDAESAFG
jgi:hypothetical protein